MDFSMSCLRFISALSIAAMVLITPAYGQTTTGCTASMITSFTPCLNFVTNSTANGTSPTSDCCNALSTITSNSTNCMCLLVTGNIPFQIPINRTLAISLPRACNMPGVPLQCKAISPAAAPTPTASIPTSTPPTQTPESDSPQVQTPTSSTTPTTTTTGSRPVLTPSAAITSSSFSPTLMLILAGILVMKLN